MIEAMGDLSLVSLRAYHQRMLSAAYSFFVRVPLPWWAVPGFLAGKFKGVTTAL